MLKSRKLKSIFDAKIGDHVICFDAYGMHIVTGTVKNIHKSVVHVQEDGDYYKPKRIFFIQHNQKWFKDSIWKTYYYENPIS